MLLLDTHVLLWMDQDDPRLGRKARRRADTAMKAGELAVSAISFWEVAMLAGKGRIAMSTPPDVWRRDLMEMGLRELPVDGGIGVVAAGLGAFHGDPADRMIVATALRGGATLVTADRQMLAWKGAVRRQDAHL